MNNKIHLLTLYRLNKFLLITISIYHIISTNHMYQLSIISVLLKITLSPVYIRVSRCFKSKHLHMNNKLSDHGKVDKLETPKAPAPQASRRKSRGGEQMNFTLPQIATVATYNQTANISNFQKKKKHWRSPSNPIDFMNCIRSKNARQVEEVKECIEEITLLTYNTNISMLKVFEIIITILINIL